MMTMLHHDEAWNGVDAMAIIRNPRLTPFLPNNAGRESGWVYWLIPYLLVFGATLFTIRLATAFLAALTLAAAYRFGRELFGPRVSFWGLAVLSIFYWHVHISTQALRANLYIFVGTLAGAFLLRAYRRNTYRAWLAGGILLGTLAYTYFASAGWLTYSVIILASVAFSDRDRRPGALLALGSAVLIWLPMMGYFVSYLPIITSRPSTVASVTCSDVLYNAYRWAEAWLVEGDANVQFNLPGRPILGTITAGFGVIGMATLTLSDRKRRGLFLIGWCAMAWFPSLLSNQAPHFLRASGMTIPIALVLGYGVCAVWGLLRMRLTAAIAFVTCFILLAFAGVDTYRDFHQTWIHDPGTYISMEQHINEAINYVQRHTPENHAVYFSPLSITHPVIQFRDADLAPRPVGAFDSHQCIVVPNTGSVTYVSLIIYEPDFPDKLSLWADIQQVYPEGSGTSSGSRYAIFNATSRLTTVQPSIRLGDILEVESLRSIPSDLSPGETASLVFGVWPLASLNIWPSLFVHLYGMPTPYEGGIQWAQADSQICASYPAHLWRVGETIIQEFSLSVPEDIPSGDYAIAIGAYPFPNDPRLPVASAGGTTYDYVVLQELRIE